MNSTRIALCDASGPLTDLLQKLSGEEGEQWLRDLGKFLRKQNPWEAPRDWAVWLTLKLGIDPKTADAICADLKAAECFVSDWAKDLLGKKAFVDSFASEEMDVELVVASVADLGFKNGATRKDIYERAQDLGLDLCPAEVGPALRKAYKDQPKGEWLLIAMEPIAGSNGFLSVFDVWRDGDGRRYLYASSGRPGLEWSADYRWVFLRRK